MPVARADASAPLGVVYTPPDVARAMVERVLAPLVEGKSPAELLALRICDPAVGEGAFLSHVIEVLVERGCDRDAVREQCVFGVDVDARAVTKTRRLTPNVRVADALAIDWRAMFGVDGFDLVVGNPPYIRQEHLASKAALRDYESYDGVADLYVYFLELAHRIARPGGRFCFLTPNKWLTVAYARPLRRFLAKQRSVEGVVDLSRAQIFDEDAFPSIVWGTVGTPQRAPIRATRIDSRAAIANALADGTPHDRARWTEEPWHIDAPSDRALIDRLQQHPALRDIAKPVRGIVTGCNHAFEIDGVTRARLLDADPAAAAIIRPLVKGRDLARWRCRSERYIVLVDHGTELDALPRAIRAHLEQFRDELEPKRERGDGPGRKPGRYRWWELQDPVGELNASRAPRLFYQDIQTTPLACIDETGFVFDTTVWALPSSDRYLLAVLNSPLYHYYAQRRFPPALNGAVRPKREYIAALPIATPSPEQRAAIEKLVDEHVAGTDREAAIAEAVLDLYALSRADRARVTARS